MHLFVATWTDIVSFAHQLGGVSEAHSYGEPSLKVGKAMLTRLRVDDRSIVLKDIDLDERDMLMAQAPDLFFTEDHYVGYDIVLARIAAADVARLTPFIERTWRRIAPKRVIAVYDNRGAAT